jgi:hypothetical protein
MLVQGLFIESIDLRYLDDDDAGGGYSLGDIVEPCPVASGEKERSPSRAKARATAPPTAPPAP